MLTAHDIRERCVALADLYPYVAVVFYALRPVPAEGLGTFGVTQECTLYFDPELDAKWSSKEIDSVLLHEIQHVLRLHTTRYKRLLKLLREREAPWLNTILSSRSPDLSEKNVHRLWGIAADAEINDDLRIDGFMLPEGGGILPSHFRCPEGLTAEDYFITLLQQPSARVNIKCSCHFCTSDKTDSNDSADATGLLDQIATEAIQAIGREAMAGKPDYDNQFTSLALKEIAISQDWRRFMSQVFGRIISRTKGMTDYSSGSHSRRSPPGVFLPGFVKPHPEVAIVWDVSSSMTGPPTDVSFSVIQHIITRLGVDRVTILPTNTRVLDTVRIRRISDLKNKASYFGGGTDMRKGIEEAIRLPYKSAMIVVVTDGETPWPQTKLTNIPVVAAIVNPTGPIMAAIPKWIKTCMVFPDQT